MDDFIGIPDFKPLDKSEQMKPLEASAVDPDGGNHRKEEQRLKDRQSHEEAKDNFEALAGAAAESNAILIAKNSPYRFCVYRQEGQVFVDIVILGPDGKIQKLVKKNITHDQFGKWIKDIRETEGLFLDEKG